MSLLPVGVVAGGPSAAPPGYDRGPASLRAVAESLPPETQCPSSASEITVVHVKARTPAHQPGVDAGFLRKR